MGPQGPEKVKDILDESADNILKGWEITNDSYIWEAQPSAVYSANTITSNL